MNTTRLLVLSLLLLSVSACSGLKGDLEQSGFKQDSSKLAYVEEAEEESDMFDFTAPDLETGASVEGSDLYENAPLLITFVVPNCPVCVSEGPKLATSVEKNPGVNYVVIHSFGAEEAYRSYAETSNLYQENVTHIADSEGLLWQQFGVQAQPSTIMVDSEGSITASIGALGDDGLERAVELVNNT